MLPTGMLRDPSRMLRYRYRLLTAASVSILNANWYYRLTRLRRVHFFLDRFLRVCYKVGRTQDKTKSTVKTTKIMRRLRRLLRKAFTPITIMIVPHSKSKLLRLRIPLTVLVALPVLWGIGTFYVISVGVQTAQYSEMSRKLSYFSSQFVEMRSTLSALQAAE